MFILGLWRTTKVFTARRSQLHEGADISGVSTCVAICNLLLISLGRILSHWSLSGHVFILSEWKPVIWWPYVCDYIRGDRCCIFPYRIQLKPSSSCLFYRAGRTVAIVGTYKNVCTSLSVLSWNKPQHLSGLNLASSLCISNTWLVMAVVYKMMSGESSILCTLNH